MQTIATHDPVINAYESATLNLQGEVMDSLCDWLELLLSSNWTLHSCPNLVRQSPSKMGLHVSARNHHPSLSCGSTFKVELGSSVAPARKSACKQCLLSSAYLAVLTYRQSITANWLVLLLMGYVFLWLIRNLCRQCYSTSIACLPCPTQTPCNHAKNA